MNPPVNQRVSPNWVMLILALLLVVWLSFEFYPRRKPAPPPMAPVQAESKLRAVGLADNPDWDGLPEFFAVTAAYSQWNDGKSWFAYWNPGSGTYSYYFEATQHDGDYRFRALSAEEISRERHQYVDEEFTDAIDVAKRSDESPTHPIVFLERLAVIRPYRPSPPHPPRGDPAYTKPSVPIDIKPEPLVIPTTEMKKP